jgi:eukaryotic-like serine/threonine-protein kinase
MSKTPSGDNAFSHRFRFADVEFDAAAMRLTVAGRLVTVEPLPLAVLAELLRRPNEAVTRAELFDQIWPEPTVDHALTSAVNKLRKALGALGAARIESVPRVGYRFAGPLERTAVGRKAAVALDLAAGRPVPQRPLFRLDRLLGQRAQSAVWLALDVPAGERRVYKFAGDGEGLAALKREYTVCRVLRQGLGERPDFARLIAAQFVTAPFFLEYEDGGADLATWAVEHDRLAGLSTDARLALFLQIARAVAAAHGLGVLHKDLKPANVLVSESPDSGGLQARLTDFGNSRLLEPGRLAELGVTAMGLTLTQGADNGGTPLYLAPELLTGRPPSVASDVYALGLMLYQLLVADFRRPMSTGWQRDIADELLVADLTAATEGQPEARLRTVDELVQRLQTLDKRRAERARSAQQAATATRAAEQLRRSRARRPWLVAAAASLVLGLAASLWSHARALDALHVAEQASLRAQAINDFMNKDVLLSADVLRASTHKTVSMLDILKRAAERAGARFEGQPRTEASVRRQLGDIFLRMQYMTQADREFARALELLAPAVPANDPELLAARFGAAQTAVGFFRPDEALRKLALAESAAGAALLDANTDLARRAARARVEVLMDAQRPQEALVAAQRLVTLADALAGSDDIAPRFEARQRLGEVYLRLGDKARADALFAELTRPPFSEGGVGEVLLSRARLRQGRELINEGRLAEAEAVLNGVRDTMTRAFGPHELYAGGANMELIDLHSTRGDFAQALIAARAAVEAFATSLGEQHYYTLNAIASLGAVELEVGDAAMALRRLEDAQPLARADKNGQPLLAAIDFGRAKAMTALGRADEALALLGTVDAAMLAESSWGPRDFEWQLQAEQARALIALGRRAEAQALLRSATAGMEKAGSYPWLLARYRALLGEQMALRR